MIATRRHLPRLLLILAAGLGTVTGAGCSAYGLPKSLFIVPTHYVNAGMLQGRKTRFVKRIDKTLSFGRLHMEGVVQANLPARIAVEEYLEAALTRAGADAVTNLEVTYYDLAIPNGLTLAIPVKTNIGNFLDGWIGIPVLSMTVHIACVRLEGDLVQIEDAASSP